MNEELDTQTKQLIERFKSRSTTSVRVLSIWVPALLVLWLSGLEPKEEIITSYVEKKTAFVKKINEVNDRKNFFKEGLLDNSEIENKKFDELKAKAKSSDEEKKKAEELAKMQFEFPGGIKVAVPIVWAPTLWIVLAFGALAYLLIQRNKLSTLSARVANRLVKNPELESLLHEVLADSPFWLAPVPRKAGIAATPEAHSAVLGWKNDHIQIGVCSLCYLALLAVEFRVSVLTFAFVDSSGSLHEKWLAPLLSLVFCLASLAVIVDALMPRNLLDSPPLESVGSVSSRRRFLMSVSAGILVLSLSAVSPRLPIIGFRHSPRFRQRKANPRSEVLAIQSRGLHINQNTKIAHYILDSGQILGVAQIAVKNLVPISLNVLKIPPKIPRVNITRSSATFELTALEYVKNKDYKSACEALKIGIRYDKVFLTKINKNPDYRLYDLLAGISVRHDLPNYLRELSDKKTSLMVLERDLRLSDRQKKWQNPNSKWHKKWKDKSKEIVWCALPMQDTSNAGNGRSNRPRTAPFRVTV